MHARFGDFTDVAQAEDLEAAGVSQDRPFPLHKVMQIAMQFHDLLARTQPEMEGIAQNDLRAGLLNFFRRHAFNGAIGANRHKRRGFHHTAIKNQTATACTPVCGIKFKFHKASIGETVQCI